MISQAASPLLGVEGLSQLVRLGDCVHFRSAGARQVGEVVRITADEVFVKPFSSSAGVQLEAPVWSAGRLAIAPHVSWLGRIVDALGEPVDGRGLLVKGQPLDPCRPAGPRPVQCTAQHAPAATGVRVIDLFTPLCAGQCMGLFAAPGAGTPALLAMLAQSEAFDVAVLAFTGGRFHDVQTVLNAVPEPRRSNVIGVVARCDESPTLRRLAPETATGIAEFFRSQGKSVLLIVDSLTQYTAALSEAMPAGDPPAGLAVELPQLVEWAGPGSDGEGAITGIYCVELDECGLNGPMARALDRILDGRIVLSDAILEERRFPAVDVRTSVSRLAGDVWSQEEAGLVRDLRTLVARFEESRDVRSRGSYQAGRDAQLDHALKAVPRLYGFLNQNRNDSDEADVFENLNRALKVDPGGQEA